MTFGWCAAEDVKFDVEPLIDVGMDGVILCAEFSWGYAFLEGFRLGGGSVLILRVQHEESVRCFSFQVAKLDEGHGGQRTEPQT